MRRYAEILVIAGSSLILGSLTIARGQDSGSKPTIEERVHALEQDVASLDTRLEMRTATPGVEDRVNRDFNLNVRLNNIERQIQQLNTQMTMLQQQVFDATRAANDASRTAQVAQQIANDAAARIH